MRKDFGSKPCMFPEPVLIIGTYDEDGTPNAMNAAWGGVHNDDEVFICIDGGHKTADNILARKAFTISFATKEAVTASDYVGIVSGKKVHDKFARAGFHEVKSQKVDAPLIEELPVALECELISYSKDTCECIGRIVNLNADESVLTDGKVDMSKFHPILYEGFNREYRAFGEKVGKAYSEGQKLNR